MSSTISKTIVLAYDLILTGVRSRQSLNSDRTCVLLNNSYNFEELTLVNGGTVDLTSINQFLFIKTDGPIDININNGGTQSMTGLFTMSGSLTSVVLSNPGTVDVHGIIFSA